MEVDSARVGSSSWSLYSDEEFNQLIAREPEVDKSKRKLERVIDLLLVLAALGIVGFYIYNLLVQ